MRQNQGNDNAGLYVTPARRNMTEENEEKIWNNRNDPGSGVPPKMPDLRSYHSIPDGRYLRRMPETDKTDRRGGLHEMRKTFGRRG